jgi:hypothetical protein
VPFHSVVHGRAADDWLDLDGLGGPDLVLLAARHDLAKRPPVVPFNCGVAAAALLLLLGL